jgi:hypothetical protein
VADDLAEDEMGHAESEQADADEEGLNG